MKNMNYKILINESGVPVLITLPLTRTIEAYESYKKPENQIHFDKPEEVKAFLRLELIKKWESSREKPTEKMLELRPDFIHDLPPNIGVSFEVNRFAKEHNAYLWKNMDKDTFVPVGLLPEKLAILTPITEAPSPSQVLTAEEVLKIRFNGLESRIAYPNVYQEKVIFAAMQEYSTLQTQQLQNRVKELEGRLEDAGIENGQLRDAGENMLLSYQQFGEIYSGAIDKWNSLKK